MRALPRIAVVVAFVLAAAACGDDSSVDEADASTSTTSVSPAGDTTIRMIPPGRFNPSQLLVRVGATVTWQDTSTPERHNVVFRDPSTGEVDPRVTSHPEQIPIDGAYAVEFTEPGVYPYACTFHEVEGMVGEITVEG